MQERYGTGIVVARSRFNEPLVLHRVDEGPTLIGPHDDECPVAKGANAAGRNVRVFSREVRALVATFARVGVGLFQGNLVKASVASPKLKDTFDVHLDDVGSLDLIFGFKEFFENRVVERFGAQQTNREAQPASNFSGLSRLHGAGRGRHAAHTHEGDAFGATFGGFGVGEEVRAVGVARLGGFNHVGARARHSRLGSPGGAVTFETTDERGVDDVVFEGVDQEGRHEAPVLAFLNQLVVAGASQQHVANAVDLVVGSLSSEAVHVNFTLPVAKAWTGSGAHGAALESVGAVVGPTVDIEMPRAIDPVVTVVIEYRVRAGDHAGRAARAKTRGDDFAEELAPLGFFDGHPSTLVNRGDGAPAGTLPRVPEVLEIESYRQLAERVVGATVSRGWSDALAAKKLTNPSAWARTVKGLTLTRAARRGKLLVLETSGVTLGMRFGMTGVLLLDSDAGLDGLFYGPHTYQAKWIRAGLEFDDGRQLVVHDPRRLARVEIDPDLDVLGPDALSLTRAQFDRAVHSERGDGPAIKARLLDQSSVAGLGNLLGDEMLFRAGIDPRTPTGTLSAAQRAALYRAFTQTMRTLGRRGGSHTGDHMEARFPGGHCPRDGAPMRSATVGGRTTYWCSRHQK